MRLFLSASFHFEINQPSHFLNHHNSFLQCPLRLNFPRGFPDEYSFMATFRMIKSTINKVWNVWQIVDEDGHKQAGLRLNGDQQALEYFLMGADGNLQTVTFPGLSVLFNTKWHKVMIGVERDQVTLYVDCQPVDRKPIKGKGPVNTEGDTLIGRLDADPGASVVVSEKGEFPATFNHVHCSISEKVLCANKQHSGLCVLSSAVNLKCCCHSKAAQLGSSVGKRKSKSLQEITVVENQSLTCTACREHQLKTVIAFKDSCVDTNKLTMNPLCYSQITFLCSSNSSGCSFTATQREPRERAATSFLQLRYSNKDLGSARHLLWFGFVVLFSKFLKGKHLEMWMWIFYQPVSF